MGLWLGDALCLGAVGYEKNGINAVWGDGMVTCFYGLVLMIQKKPSSRYSAWDMSGVWGGSALAIGSSFYHT